MTLRVPVILSSVSAVNGDINFIKESELEPARIGQVVYLVVNFYHGVKLTRHFIVMLFKHSVDVLNF